MSSSNINLVLLYLLDDYFEKIVSLKEEFKIPDNKLTPRDILGQFVSFYFNPTNPESPEMKRTKRLMICSK